MKNIFFLLFVTYTSYFTGQVYSGKVVDNNQQPLPYVETVFESNNGEQVFGMTDEKGSFKTTMDTEASILLLSSIGYKDKMIEVKSFELGEIILEEENIQLETVVVKGKKKLIEQKVDRTVFNVENSIASSGGDATDLLKITPRLILKNDDLLLIGKGSVIVMVDDKVIQLKGEELIAYLSSIPSDNIKSIEVIDNPPAKYDAEGNSGLVNIVLKKPKSESWNVQTRTSYIQGTYPLYNIGNTFNYNHNKIQIVSSIQTKFGQDYSELKYKIYYPESIWKDKLKIKEKLNKFSGNIGLDYSITKMASVGFQYKAFTNNSEEDGKSRIEIEADNILQNYIYNKSNTENDRTSHSANVHYIQKLDTLGRKLSFDFDLFSYEKDNQSNFNSIGSNDSNNFNNDSNQKINNYSGRVDMEHPFKWANMTYGAKYTHTETESQFSYNDLITGVPINDPSQTDQYEYNENITAVYIDFVKNLAEKWESKFGLRLEKSETISLSKTYNQEDTQNYTRLFPTVFLGYLQDGNHSYHLSYSKRINRPSFWSLNPFKSFISANSYVEGNPFLKPTIDDNTNFKFTYKNKFITEVYVSYTKDGSGQVIKADADTNSQIFTQSNFYNGFSYGINQTIMYNPTNWWNTLTQLSANTTDISFDDDIDLTAEVVEGWNYSVYSNHTFDLNKAKTIQAEAMVFWQSEFKKYFYQVDAMVNFDIGFKALLYKKKLKLSINLSDVFRSSSPDITVNTNGIKQVYNSYYDNRYLKFGVSFLFGNNKIQANQREGGNKDEVGRIQ